jgi:hypothetical protein
VRTCAAASTSQTLSTLAADWVTTRLTRSPSGGVNDRGSTRRCSGSVVARRPRDRPTAPCSKGRGSRTLRRIVLQGRDQSVSGGRCLRTPEDQQRAARDCADTRLLAPRHRRRWVRMVTAFQADVRSRVAQRGRLVAGVTSCDHRSDDAPPSDDEPTRRRADVKATVRRRCFGPNGLRSPAPLCATHADSERCLTAPVTADRVSSAVVRRGTGRYRPTSGDSEPNPRVGDSKCRPCGSGCWCLRALEDVDF